MSGVVFLPNVTCLHDETVQERNTQVKRVCAHQMVVMAACERQCQLDDATTDVANDGRWRDCEPA